MWLTRLRVVWWLSGVRWRLRVRRCRLTATVGHGVRCATLPKVRLTGDSGGSVSIEIGDEVDLGRMILLDLDVGRDSVLSIGAGTTFEHAVRLQLQGGQVDLGPNCEVRDGATLKASSSTAKLAIGDQTKIGRGVAIHCHEMVVIADRVTLADRVTVVDSFHDVDGTDTWTMDAPLVTGPVRIERNAIVYSGAVIVHDTTIGANSVVAANALVSSAAHEEGVVLVGNPARRVRRLGPTPATDQGG